MSGKTDPAPDEASSRFPWPPMIFVLAFVAAVAAGWLTPLPILPEALVWPLRILGLVLLVAAVALPVIAERAFHRAGTPALPTQPTREIVADGIYAYSRNPMYLGMTGALLAWTLVLDSPWFIVAAPVAVYAVTKLAIEPEEAYLAGKFGETYRAYRSRVRRWL